MKEHEKYVIEISEILPSKDGNDLLARINHFNALVFDQNGLNKLEKLESAAKVEYGIGYQRGYEAGKQKESDAISERLDTLEEAYDKGFANGMKHIVNAFTWFIDTHCHNVGLVLNEKDDIDYVIENYEMRNNVKQSDDPKPQFIRVTVRDIKGVPYYEIEYKEGDKTNTGYGSFDLNIISEYLSKYFSFKGE